MFCNCGYGNKSKDWTKEHDTWSSVMVDQMIYQSWLSNDWALDFESDWVNQSRKMPLADLARPLWFLSTASFNSAGDSLIALHLSSECPLVLDSWHWRTKLERYYHISLTAKVYRWASTEYIASIDYKCLSDSHYMYYLLHRRRLQIRSLIPRWLGISLFGAILTAILARYCLNHLSQPRFDR